MVYGIKFRPNKPDPFKGKTPLTEKALQNYGPSRERIWDADYQKNLILKRLFEQRHGHGYVDK